MKTCAALVFTALFIFSQHAFAQPKGCGGHYMSPTTYNLCGAPYCSIDTTIDEGESITLRIQHCEMCHNELQQWYRDGEPIGEPTDRTITVTTPGLYTVMGTTGCDHSGYLLNSVNVHVTPKTTAVQPEPRAQKLLIYPNPVEDVLNIEFENISGTKEIELFSPLGQRVESITTAQDYFSIDLSKLGDTPLFLILRDETGKTWMKKIMRKL